MFGATMGTLDVFVNTTMYCATGDMGDQWNIANIDLSTYVGTDVTIVISGTAGSSFTSDMAIDAISLDGVKHMDVQIHWRLTMMLLQQQTMVLAIS